MIGSVRSQSAAGGLVTGVTGPMTIVTAGAAGLSQQQAITSALTAAATALHRQARPIDVAPDNTVPSSRVASARISYGGKGAINDANTAGWLSRFFNSPWTPF